MWSLILEQASQAFSHEVLARSKKESGGTQAFWGLGPELAQHDFCHILSAKVIHKASLDLGVKEDATKSYCKEHGYRDG